MVYHVFWVSPPGPDKGVDIIAHSDPLGIQGSRIKVQIKRRADRIKVDGVRSLLALLGEDDAGIFVSAEGSPEKQNQKHAFSKTGESCWWISIAI